MFRHRFVEEKPQAVAFFKLPTTCGAKRRDNAARRRYALECRFPNFGMKPAFGGRGTVVSTSNGAAPGRSEQLDRELRRHRIRHALKEPEAAPPALRFFKQSQRSNWPVLGLGLTPGMGRRTRIGGIAFKRCVVRALVGLCLLVGGALFGLEHLTTNRRLAPVAGFNVTQAGLIDSAATNRPGDMVQTVAATQSTRLPDVQAAPNAPRAEQISPIVPPVQKVAPKVVAPAKAAVKSNAGKTKPAAKTVKAKDVPVVARPGFKLSCTAAQKLDAAKHKCVPLKSQARGVTKNA